MDEQLERGTECEVVSVFSLTVFVGSFVVVLSASYSSISMTGSIHAAMFFFVLLTLWLAAYTMAIIDYAVLPPCVRKGVLRVNFIKALAEEQGHPVVFEKRTAIRHRERWRRFIVLLFIRDLYAVGIFAFGAAWISHPPLRVMMLVFSVLMLGMIFAIWRCLARVDAELLFPDRRVADEASESNGHGLQAVAEA